MSSDFGTHIRLSVFGTSHGQAIGAVVDGLPCGYTVDMEEVRRFMKRRAPGQSLVTTQRKEADEPIFLSGIVDDTLSGSPLAFYIANTNQRSADYNNLRDVPRPSHADYTARMRYGDSVDMRGGGHFSGRLTAPLCCAGAIALQILARHGIRVGAHLRRLGNVADDEISYTVPDMDALHRAGFETVAMISPTARLNAINLLDRLRNESDSTGGIIEVFATGLPAGLGNPNFDGIENRLSRAVFGIPGVKGIAFGTGFDACERRGSEENDPFALVGDTVTTVTNHCGGIQGGITNGMPLVVRIGMKPTASIAKPQKSFSFEKGENTELLIKGRHDPCIAVRAVPVAEAVTALVILDFLVEIKKELR